jgi:predicted N-acetyltransferase YhbS
MSKTPAVIAPEQPGDLNAIEDLLDEAFGLDRRVKTAYRLREASTPVPGLSFVTRLGDRLVGTIRFWPIVVAHRFEALLLGPLAVALDLRGLGYGIGLMEHGLARAAALGHERVILVGDEPYYARVGFVRSPDGKLKMPGWVDADRLLYKELVPGSMGAVRGLIMSPLRSPSFAVPGEAEQHEQGRQAKQR